jgi:hypothetical protein
MPSVPPGLRFIVALVVFVALVLVSARVGVPHDARGREDLPDIALDWRLLFHVLRASAVAETALVVNAQDRRLTRIEKALMDSGALAGEDV